MTLNELEAKVRQDVRDDPKLWADSNWRDPVEAIAYKHTPAEPDELISMLAENPEVLKTYPHFPGDDNDTGIQTSEGDSLRCFILDAFATIAWSWAHDELLLKGNESTRVGLVIEEAAETADGLADTLERIAKLVRHGDTEGANPAWRVTDPKEA